MKAQRPEKSHDTPKEQDTGMDLPHIQRRCDTEETEVLTWRWAHGPTGPKRKLRHGCPPAPSPMI